MFCHDGVSLRAFYRRGVLIIIRERLLWRRQLVDRYFTTYEMVSRNSSAECGRYVRRRSHQLLLPGEAITRPLQEIWTGVACHSVALIHDHLYKIHPRKFLSIIRCSSVWLRAPNSVLLYMEINDRRWGAIAVYFLCPRRCRISDSVYY